MMRLLNHHVKVYVVLFTLFSLLLVDVTATKVSAAQSTTDALGVVFLIDQTSSMATSDPDNVRSEAVRYVMNWLGEFRARKAELNIQFTIKVSVINFWYAPKNETDKIPTQEVLTMTFESNSLSEWEKEAAQNLGGWRNSDSGKTLGNGDATTQTDGADYVNAISQALTQLKKFNVSRQALVMITDSTPTWENATGFTQTFRTLKTLFQEQGNRALISNFHILTLNGGTRQGEWWKEFKFDNLWGTILGVPSTNYHYLENKPWQISSKLLAIVTSFPSLIVPTVDNKPQEINAVYEISPYQKQARFTIFKTSNSQSLKLTLPDKTTLESNSPLSQVRQGQNTSIETITILNPPPGAWTVGLFTDSNNATDIKYYGEQSPLLLHVKAITPTAQQYQRIKLVLREFGDAELPKSYTSDQLLKVNGIVTLPKGEKQTFDYIWDGQKGEYVLDFIPIELGKYSVQTVATINNQPFTNLVQANPFETTKTNFTLVPSVSTVVQNQSFDFILQALNNNTGIDLPDVRPQLTIVPKSSDCTQGKALATITAEQSVYKEQKWMLPFLPTLSTEPDQAIKACLTAQVITPQGQQITIAENQPIGDALAINPVTYLKMVFKSKDGVIQQVNETSLPLQWQPIPLELEVAIVKTACMKNDSYQSLDEIDVNCFANIMTDATLSVAPQLKLVVGADDLSSSAPLKPASREGVWQATLENPRSGNYSVELTYPSGLVGKTLTAFADNGAPHYQMIGKAVIDTNWARYQFWGVVSIGVFAFVFLVGVNINREITKARGRIIFTSRVQLPNMPEVVIGKPIHLVKYRQKHVRVKAQDFPLLDPTISSLEVLQKNSQTVEVWVSINGDAKRHYVFSAKGQETLYSDDQIEYLITYER